MKRKLTIEEQAALPAEGKVVRGTDRLTDTSIGHGNDDSPRARHRAKPRGLRGTNAIIYPVTIRRVDA